MTINTVLDVLTLEEALKNLYEKYYQGFAFVNFHKYSVCKDKNSYFLSEQGKIIMAISSLKDVKLVEDKILKSISISKEIHLKFEELYDYFFEELQKEEPNCLLSKKDKTLLLFGHSFQLLFHYNCVTEEPNYDQNFRISVIKQSNPKGFTLFEDFPRKEVFSHYNLDECVNKALNFLLNLIKKNKLRFLVSMHPDIFKKIYLSKIFNTSVSMKDVVYANGELSELSNYFMEFLTSGNSVKTEPFDIDIAKEILCKNFPLYLVKKEFYEPIENVTQAFHNEDFIFVRDKNKKTIFVFDK